MHAAPPIEQAPSLPADRARVLLRFTPEPHPSGSGMAETLLVTASELVVTDAKGTRVHRFPLTEIQELRVAPVLGAGLFQIKVNGVWLDLLTFSNRFRNSFETVARSLDKLRRGEDLDEVMEADQFRRCPRCGLRLALPGEPCPRCRRHGQAFRRALDLVRPYWKSTLLLVGLLFAGVGLDMVWPLLTRYLVDHVLTHPGNGDMHTLLVTVVLALVSVQVCRAGVSVLTGRLGGYIGNALTYNLRSKLVSKLGQVGLGFYHRQQAGSLVSKIMHDTESVYGFINQLTAGFLMQVVLVVCSLVFMFSLAPRLALLALSPAPLIIAGAFVYWRIIYPFFQKYLERVSRQAGLLTGTVTGIKVVKVFGQEETEYSRFQKSSGQLRNTRARLDRTNAFFHPAMSLVFQAGGWLIWYLGGKTVLEGTVTLGTLVAFFGYMSMFYGPLGSLTTFTTWVSQFSVQVHRLVEILDVPVEDVPPHRPVVGAASDAEIEFRDVTFGYTQAAPVLRKVSFKIRAGEHVGIIGSNGSGKTSIANALCRLYPISSGQILLRGVDLRDVSHRQLRSELGMVLQESTLFRGSLLENISYGNPEGAREQVLRVSRAVNAHEFIMNRPLAYDSLLGEGGQGLSGGERQKVNLARTLLRAPRILLLDEATSQVDTESVVIIHNSIRQLMKGRTTLTIAHRLREITSSDRIMALERGRIAEMGPPAELLRQNGAYADWVRAQQGQQSPDSLSESPPDLSEDPEFDAAFETRWIMPPFASFDRGPHGELTLNLARSPAIRGVFVVRCFPVTHPESYLSLRYLSPENKSIELGLIADLNKWPQPEQSLIRRALKNRYCWTVLKRIHSIQRADPLLIITADSETGRVELLVRSGPECIQEYGPRGGLLADFEENLYFIPDISALPRADQALFHRFVYWFPDLEGARSNSQTR